MEQVQLGQSTLQIRRQLIKDGERVPIGRRGLEILSVLAEAQGEIVTKDELMAAVWPQSVVEENAMQAQITALRKALGHDAALLKTIRGIGYQLDLSGHGTVREAVSQNPSILVMPFENMSGDPEQNYFADGIAEDIITDLSKVSALRVIARTSAFTLKGQSVDVKEVARRFNVTHVLEGSVRKAGGRVRITAQLINGTDAGHVWAERYDRNLQHVFELQDALSKAIVEVLKVKLAESEKKAMSSRGTDNVDAYDLYLRAQELARSFAPGDARRALELYHEALELDPDFALALHGLSDGLTRAMLNAAGDPEVLSAERNKVFERQSSLAPDDWHAQLAIGTQRMAEFRMCEAEEALLKAIAAAPGSEIRPLFQHSILLFTVGRISDALEVGRSMMRVEPLSIEVSIVVQICLQILQMTEEAEREYERSRDLPGDRGVIEFHWFLYLAQLGNMERSRQQLARFLRYDSIDSPAVRTLSQVLNWPDKARQLIRAEVDRPRNRQSTHQTTLALLAGLYGDTDVALEALRRSYIELRSVARVQSCHPLLAEARRDPRFKQLMRVTGVCDYWRATGRWGDFARPLGEADFEIIR